MVLPNPSLDRSIQDAGDETCPQRSENSVRIFNTAIVSSRSLSNRDFSSEIGKLLESRALDFILDAVKRYANENRISEMQAAEEVIGTFRKIDQFWTDYLLKEGIERLKQNS